MVALSLLTSQLAQASYRVYELDIVHFDAHGQRERIERIVTNLDPLQYAAFQGGDGRMKVRLLDTWFCPGDTAGRLYCARPKTRQPASFDHDKRTPLPGKFQPVIP